MTSSLKQMAAAEERCGFMIGAARTCAKGDFSAHIIDCLQSRKEGLVMEAEIEFVARALYNAEDDAQVWEREPDIVKDEFRLYAQAALELLAEHRKPKMPGAEICVFPYAA
jgi:hypothetical protein